MDSLRNRSRDMVRKNPYAANIVDTLVANCIGAGIKPQSKALDADFRKRCAMLQHHIMVFQFCRLVWQR